MGAERADARRQAAALLDRVLAKRLPLDSLWAAYEEHLDDRDRRLLRELVLGSLRWLARLDQVLVAASGRPLERIERPLLAPLRIGAYQLLFLDRVPAHAAVDRAVTEARRRSHRGGAGFVNAVLRKVAASPALADWPVQAGDTVEKLAIETSHPELLVRGWIERFGEQRTLSLLEANNRPKPQALLAFSDRGGRQALAAALAAEGVRTEPSALSKLGLVVRAGEPLTTEAFHRGDGYLQDEASQAAAWVPPPRPGERVLDAAAAPGGKSFALQAREPTVRVVAADRSPARLQTVVENSRRLQRTLPLVAADAAMPPFTADFDRVVLDLPCTGTGTLRAHPELKWRVSRQEIRRLAAQSGRLLAAAAPLVRGGGLLVAITCSLEREENEAIAERFLAKNAEFAPVDLNDQLPASLRAHVAGPGLWRVLTADDHDGFTVQVLRRRG